MRTAVSWIIVAGGIVCAVIGMIMAGNDITNRALILLMLGVTLLSGALIYLLATEDRGTGLVMRERRHRAGDPPPPPA
jgi:uncharacterized membrane protein HdeD (DUF308 family)